jgi:hypothetical protein
LSSFLQRDAKKSPSSLRSLCGRYEAVMKKRLLLLIIPVMAHADPSSDLLEALHSFDTKSITEKNGELLVVLNENRITSDIFYNLIDGGFCVLPWLNNRIAIENINKVVVLNRHEHQGYILENGVESCDERSDKNQKESKLLLAYRTSLY